MKVLVTGGAGFIGSHLVDRLMAEPQTAVVVLDDLSTGCRANLVRWQADSRLELVEGNVADVALVAAAVEGASVVYHLAARPAGSRALEGVDGIFTTNVVGTFNVLRAAVEGGVSRVVYASASEVYGEPMDLPVDESHPLLAVDCYGATKAAGEALCRAFRREFDLHTIILRLANVYGPRDTGRVIPIWLERAMAGRDLDVYGGKQVYDFVWVADAVEALVRAGAQEDLLPPINVGSGTGTKIVDVARRITHLTSGRSRVRMLPAQQKPAVTRFVANVERMRHLLQIDPPLDPLLHLPSLVLGANMADSRRPHLRALP